MNQEFGYILNTIGKQLFLFSQTKYEQLQKVNVQAIMDKYFQQADQQSKQQLNLDIIQNILFYDYKNLSHQKLAGYISVYQLLQKEFDMDFYLTKQNTKFINIYNKYKKEIHKFYQTNKHLNYKFDYFSIQTMKKTHLMIDHIDSKLENPLQMFLRVSIQIFVNECDNESQLLENIFKNTHLMANKYIIHASPTLFNSGQKEPQLSSCFLLQMQDDSIQGIYKDTFADSAMILKSGGGISIYASNIRSIGQIIQSSGTQSQGILPILKCFNQLCKNINQGGRRMGSIAFYFEIYYPEIEDILHLKKNTTNNEIACRDLFFGIVINDLFMQRVINNEKWSLFDPHFLLKNYNIQLENHFGQEFNQIYLQLEQKNLYTKQISAQTLFDQICKTQIEASSYYILNRDQVNKASNQINLGVIKQSNLCIEIVQYTDQKQQAVCNLGALNVKKFYCRKNKTLDKQLLKLCVQQLVQNIDNIIDINYYPTTQSQYSNEQTRTQGIGIIGLQNLLFKLQIPFDSQQAEYITQELHQHIYYYALEKSMLLAKEKGKYPRFDGSQFSQGILQFDNYNHNINQHIDFGLNWQQLKSNIIKYGTRNSLLTSVQPTASISQLLNCYESIEPQQSNIFKRQTQAGEFIVVNKYLLKQLQRDFQQDEYENILNQIIQNNGSIQGINILTQDYKNLYKTVWEISQKILIRLCQVRQKYIDQSQSMNLFLLDPTIEKVRNMLIYSWKSELKTIIYYLRQKSSSQNNKFVCTGCI